ncbi:hypothetical protein AVEN_172887-1, partial [Araneus ventricosus]
IPKIRIRLNDGKPFIVNSEENYQNLQTEDNTVENVEIFSSTIADKVKLCKRGQRSTSNAELYKTISETSLSGSKRNRNTVSSNAVSSSSATATFDETSIDDLPSKKIKLLEHHLL